MKFSKKENRTNFSSKNKKRINGVGVGGGEGPYKYAPKSGVRSLRSPFAKKNPYALLTAPFSPRSLLHRRRWDRLTANGEKRNREIILPLLTPFPGIAATLLFLLSVVLHCVCRNSAVSSSFWSENPVDEHGERALENCGDNSTRFLKKKKY